MRVCLYTSTALPNLGGQEIVVDALARHMTAVGHQPYVLAPQPRMFGRCMEMDTCYPVLRHARFWSMRRGVEAFHRALVQFHRRYRFDVIHCHGIYPPAYLAAISGNELGVPIVVTSHGEDVEESNRHLAEPRLLERYRLAVAQATAFVAISAHTRQGLRRLGVEETRIVNIPNGVDCAMYRTPVERPPALEGLPEYVLFLGRLEERKGVHVLLEAWNQLPVKVRPALVIAGEGSQQPDLERQARRARLADVHFLGTCTGRVKTYLLQNAITSVAPSVGWESFGLTVIEAQAAGCPVICSDLVGMRDLVTPGQTGWHVPPGDVASLRVALGEAIANRTETRRRGKLAALAAQQFDWRHVTQRHVSLFQSLRNGSQQGMASFARAAA